MKRKDVRLKSLLFYPEKLTQSIRYKVFDQKEWNIFLNYNLEIYFLSLENSLIF